MSIINLIVRILTFFGTAFRATVEQLACRGQRLIVEDVSFFSRGRLCGHVPHEMPRTKRNASVLCLRPFFVNLVLGLIILIPSSINVLFLENYKITMLLLYWIGISLWTNLFPSRLDATVYKAYTNASRNPLSRLMGRLLFFGARAEATGLTLLTSVAASFLIAQLAKVILPLFYSLVESAAL